MCQYLESRFCDSEGKLTSSFMPLTNALPKILCQSFVLLGIAKLLTVVRLVKVLYEIAQTNSGA